MKTLGKFLVLMVLAACEQTNFTPEPTSVPNTINRAVIVDSITNGRRNAITRAVEFAEKAVVSVGVTELVQQGGNIRVDPFFGFYYDPGRMTEMKSLGSGFIVSEDGLVLTNQHVIGDNAATIQVTVQSKKYNAQLIGADEFTDIALLQLDNPDNEKFHFLNFGDADSIIVGEWCIAMGNPFGLFEDGQATVTVGVVSAINRDFRPEPEKPRVYTQMIQTDAPINSGNSGGPLLNSLGEVIGMNTFIFSPNQGYVGLSFAIPSNRVVKIVNQLKTQGKITLDYDLGMETIPVNPRLAYRYNIPLIPNALLVVTVNKDGPAYEAGILPRDILFRIGKERVQGTMHAQALFREFAAGDTMTVEIIRDNKRYASDIFLRPKAE